MRQLGIIDSAFINMENPRIPQQAGAVGIARSPPAQNGAKDTWRAGRRIVKLATNTLGC